MTEAGRRYLHHRPGGEGEGGERGEAFLACTSLGRFLYRLGAGNRPARRRVAWRETRRSGLASSRRLCHVIRLTPLRSPCDEK